MDRSTIIAKLREHEPELKAAGIVRLSLFGSVARGDQTPQSDIDLMADFAKTKRLYVALDGQAGEPPYRFAWNEGRPFLAGLDEGFGKEAGAPGVGACLLGTPKRTSVTFWRASVISRSFVDGVDFDAYRQSEKTKSAVEHSILRLPPYSYLSTRTGSNPAALRAGMYPASSATAANSATASAIAAGSFAFTP
jgi:hypothetical protein